MYEGIAVLPKPQPVFPLGPATTLQKRSKHLPHKRADFCGDPREHAVGPEAQQTTRWRRRLLQGGEPSFPTSSLAGYEGSVGSGSSYPALFSLAPTRSFSLSSVKI